jgi:lysophospholipase L1-like esterase
MKLCVCALTAVGIFSIVTLARAAGQSPDVAQRREFVLPKATPEQKEAAEKVEMQRLRNDWAYLARYRDANARLPSPSPREPRVVFMGDSLTENWGDKNNSLFHDLGEFFPGRSYINRGISGQTSPQMLVRFHQDVIDLRPKVVVILAGTNDIAENTGKTSLNAIENNIDSMCELARASGIRVALGSVLPAQDFWWHHGLSPAPKIRALNAWIKDYAQKRRLVFIDYYSAMVDADGGLKAALSPDGIHPNGAGYAVMGPLAEAGIASALRDSP